MKQKQDMYISTMTKEYWLIGIVRKKSIFVRKPVII